MEKSKDEIKEAVTELLLSEDGRLTILLAIATSPKNLTVEQLNKALNAIKGIAELCDVDPMSVMIAVNEAKFKK